MRGVLLRPVRIALLFLLTAGLVAVVAATTSGWLAYVLAAVVVVVIVAVGSPLALTVGRPRPERHAEGAHYAV
jgi:hypothetical protein